MLALTSLVATALTLVVLIERISEYLMKLIEIIFNFVLSVFDVEVPERIVTSQIKLLLVSALNFGLYITIFGFDFTSATFADIGVRITPVQGVWLSGLLVSGGSNLVHEFFGFFRHNRPA